MVLKNISKKFKKFWNYTAINYFHPYNTLLCHFICALVGCTAVVHFNAFAARLDNLIAFLKPTVETQTFALYNYYNFSHSCVIAKHLYWLIFISSNNDPIKKFCTIYLHLIFLCYCFCITVNTVIFKYQLQFFKSNPYRVSPKQITSCFCKSKALNNYLTD